MFIPMSVSAPDLDDESLQELTRRLCLDLHDEAGVESSLVERSAGSGTKGAFEIIGQVLIKAVGASGAIVALVNVLKVYVQRKPSLQFELQTKGGDNLKIKADDLRSNDMTKLVQTIKEAFEEA
jgi:Effector Associated Constant Component 1